MTASAMEADSSAVAKMVVVLRDVAPSRRLATLALLLKVFIEHASRFGIGRE